MGRWVGHFYPRPPRGGRQAIFSVSWVILQISIHALREEGDLGNIRRGAGRLQFLSTPSARRATVEHIDFGLFSVISIHALREEGDLIPSSFAFASTWDFYPRPPRGGRPPPNSHCRPTLCISIHALREEGDVTKESPLTIQIEFLSTPSARRATVLTGTTSQTLGYFYPRPPRGGRQRPVLQPLSECIFLSTPSARRATIQHRRPPA